MGFRMRKSIKLGGGVRVNLSKKGVGYSVGTKGYRVTKKAGGGIRTTASLPGSGLSYVKETGSGKKSHGASHSAAGGTVSSAGRPSHLTATDRRDPEKAIAKYENCLASRMKMVVLFMIIAVACASVKLTVLAVIAFVIGVIYFAAKNTWQQNIKELEELMAEKEDAASPSNTDASYSDSDTGEKTPTSSPAAFENFHVTGVSFRENDIEDLGTENSEYEMSKSEIVESGLEEERIYKFLYAPQQVELVPEPENPHDPNAIKVCMDGVHVGYIKKGSISRVKNLLAGGGKVSGEITGGPYKYVYMDEDSDKYELERGTAPYSVVISITK